MPGFSLPAILILMKPFLVIPRVDVLSGRLRTQRQVILTQKYGSLVSSRYRALPPLSIPSLLFTSLFICSYPTGRPFPPLSFFLPSLSSPPIANRCLLSLRSLTTHRPLQIRLLSRFFLCSQANNSSHLFLFPSLRNILKF